MANIESKDTSQLLTSEFSKFFLNTVSGEFSSQAQYQLLTRLKNNINYIQLKAEDLPSDNWIIVKNNRKEFSVLFNPEVSVWLKVAMKDSLVHRLIKAQEAQKASLELSNVNSSLALTRNIKLNGKDHTATQTPHLGLSLKFMMQGKLINKYSVWQIYRHCHRLACDLARRDWIFADANPGNIIVGNLNQPMVTLIDFHNRRIATNSGLSANNARYIDNQMTAQLNKLNIPHDPKELEYASNQLLLKNGTINKNDCHDRTF